MVMFLCIISLFSRTLASHMIGRVAGFLHWHTSCEACETFSIVTASIMFWQVFEKAIHASEEASEDPEGRYQYQFWHELIIRTNQAHDLLFLVFVHCPQDLAAGRMERLNKQLKEFFENGEGKKCGVVSLYTKVTYTYVHLKWYQIDVYVPLP